MQQIVQKAIDLYIRSLGRGQRPQRSVSIADFRRAFAGLEAVDLDTFRADQERSVDSDAYFDAYKRAYSDEDL